MVHRKQLIRFRRGACLLCLFFELRSIFLIFIPSSGFTIDVLRDLEFILIRKNSHIILLVIP